MNSIADVKLNLASGALGSAIEDVTAKADSITSKLKAVDAQMEQSHRMRVKAELAVMEGELTDMLNDDDEIAVLSDGNNNEAPVEVSSRKLELQRRRALAKDVRHDIGNGAAILKSLAQNTDLIIKYLGNAERELDHLEAVEREATMLQKECTELREAARKTAVKINDQAKQLHILEAKKNQSREMLSTLRAEVNQLTSENEKQRAKIALQNTKAGKLTDDVSALNEKLEVARDNNKSLWQENDSLTAERDHLAYQLKDAEQALCTKIELVNKLQEDKNLATMQMKEANSHNAVLKERCAELAAEAEEKTYRLEALVADYEEKIRIRDARIFELESDINVTEKQVMLADDMIAKLNGKLSELKQESVTQAPSTIDQVPGKKAKA